MYIQVKPSLCFLKVCLVDISADGNVIIGGQNLIYPAEVQHFVYYVSEQEAEVIGTDEFFSTGSTVTSACISTNGEWVGGTARLITPIEGSQFPAEQQIPYRYNTRTKEFTPYTTDEHHEAGATAIFNNGLIAVALMPFFSAISRKDKSL